MQRPTMIALTLAAALLGAAPADAKTVQGVTFPDTATIGPLPQPISIWRVRLRAASAGAIGFPSVPSALTSASPGGLSWSKPSAVRSTA